MKKKNIIIGSIILLIVLVIGSQLVKSKDYWNCKDGQWLRIGSPKYSQPQTPCSGEKTDAALPTIPPDSTVVSFYSWLKKNPDEITKESYKQSPYLTDEYKQKIQQEVIHDTTDNPFVCANVLPESYKVTKSSAQKTKAVVTIKETFTTEEKSITLELVAIGKRWQIANVVCPQS